MLPTLYHGTANRGLIMATAQVRKRRTDLFLRMQRAHAQPLAQRALEHERCPKTANLRTSPLHVALDDVERLVALYAASAWAKGLRLVTVVCLRKRLEHLTL